jgi:hypothetical protein
MSDDEEGRRLDSLRTVRTTHAGAQFESGEVYELRGRNEPAPGVEVEDGREEEQQWTGGRQNYATDSGRRRRLADTRASKQVQDPRRGQGMLTIYKSEDAIEDERWVYITEVKANGTKNYLCVACGHVFVGSQEKVITHKLQLGGVVAKCKHAPTAACRAVLERISEQRQRAKAAGSKLGTASAARNSAVASTPPVQSMLGGSETTRTEKADEALARWCVAHDVPWAAVCSRNELWCAVVRSIKATGIKFVPAPREVLSQDEARSIESRAGGLHLALKTMGTDKEKILAAAMEEGGTVVSDGAKLKSRKRGMLNTGLVTRAGVIMLQQTDATGKMKDGEFLRDDYVAAVEKAGPLTKVTKQVGETIVTKRKSAVAKLLITDRGGGCERALRLTEDVLIILADTCKGHGADLLIEDFAKPFKSHLKKVSPFFAAPPPKASVHAQCVRIPAILCEAEVQGDGTASGHCARRGRKARCAHGRGHNCAPFALPLHGQVHAIILFIINHDVPYGIFSSLADVLALLIPAETRFATEIICARSLQQDRKQVHPL